MTSFFAWNTRGFNEKRKQNTVRSRILESRPTFGCLLETRVKESKSVQFISRVFEGCNYETNYEYHRLGKVWLVWTDDVKVTVLNKSAQMITVGMETNRGETFICSSIYASNFRADRQLLREEIKTIKDQYNTTTIPWILLGDFNVILASDEHSRMINRRSDQSGMVDFQQLVHDCDLRDLPSVDPKFTWWNHQDSDPISKKLDRVLINGSWNSLFPDSFSTVETNGISDHTRYVVKMTNVIHKKKRHFQFFNYLTKHPLFMDIVGQYWSTTERLYHSRSAIYLFGKKLKALKAPLRALNKDIYGDITRRTQIAFNVLCERQRQALEDPNADTFAAEEEAAREWHHYADIEEEFFRQKSRINWLRLGDHNTGFFHKAVQARRAQNTIRAITTASGITLTDPKDIKAEAVDYFRTFLQENIQREDDHIAEEIGNLIDYRCSDTIRDELTRDVSEEEIKRALLSMPSGKTPGPDGYTKEFFVAAWPVIGQDFTTAVQSYFLTSFMPHGANATILTLVPKRADAVTMKDYRPIACCNTMYKVISKILASRLKTLLPEAILPNQSAFIGGRLLLENVLLATELVRGYHKDKTSTRCALKIDIAKAFDTVKWDFILSTLQAMGIPDLFVSWIRGCISTAAFSVNVNGELEGFFNSARGLRQGCSLSPALFVIAINVLSHRLNRAAKQGKFGYHPKCRDGAVTHLSFADDMIIFANGSPSSISGITQTLHDFEAESGLAINLSKSALYMGGKPSQETCDKANELNIPIEQLPIRYLGLPLTTKKMTRLDYEPLIDRIRSRLLAWSNKSLSYAGRLQLISSVIASITNFWCSAFRLPNSCLQTIERMCAAFLWSGNPHITTKSKVSWDDVCYPRREGGLGIRRLKDTAAVLMMKLIWRILTNETSLWVDWVKRYLLRETSLWDIKTQTTRGSWMWTKLLKTRDLAFRFLKYEIRDGQKTFFWFDNWLQEGSLKQAAGDPGLSRQGIRRQAKVAEVVNDTEWKIQHGRGQLARRLMELLNCIQPPSPGAGPDCILWHEGQGNYTNKFNNSTTWEQIRKRKKEVRWSRLVWFPQAIPRHAFILWLTFLNRLSTGARAADWGQRRPCSFCGEINETREHLYFACPYTYTIWSALATNLLGSRTTPDWSSTINTLLHNRLTKVDALLARMSLQTTIYWIWRERNGRIHHSQNHTPLYIARLVHKDILNRLQAVRKDGNQATDAAINRWNETPNLY